MIDSGNLAVVTNDQIVSSAKLQLKIETSDQDIWFMKLANDAVRRLRTTSTIIKRECSLIINNGKAKLPHDYQQLIAIRYNNQAGGQDGSTANCAQMVYVDMPFLTNCGCNTNIPGIQNMRGAFQINGNHILFYGSMPDGTEAQIAYFATNVDEHGLRTIYERYEDAVVAYICWMWTIQNANEYNQYLIEKWEDIWTAQKRMLRSIDAKDNFNNTKVQMREVANALIHDMNWTTGV
jgi:hypothetical protein